MSRIAIAAARAEALAARAALAADLDRLKERARPANLAATAAEAAVTQVRSRPAVIAGAVALAGLTLAVPSVRRAALRTACLAWRNRTAISGLLALRRMAG